MGSRGRGSLSPRRQLEALPDEPARDALVAQHVAVPTSAARRQHGELLETTA